MSPAKSSKPITLQNQLALLEKEAQRVEAAHDIRRLQRAYGYYLDQALWDEMADLFTADGTIEIALDGVYVGQKRIREYLYKLGGGQRGLKVGQLRRASHRAAGGRRGAGWPHGTGPLARSADERAVR